MPAMRHLAPLLAALAFGACKEEEPPPPPPDTGDSDDIDRTPIPVTLQFQAIADGAPFACGRDVPNQGAASNSTLRFGDLRMFLMNVGLVDRSGNTALLELDANDWQDANIALLDFAGDGCAQSDVDTNFTVTGTVVGGDYVGVAFTIGVPFEQNHRAIDFQTPAPLQKADLFEGVPYGYNFIKLDLASRGKPDGWPVRLRSSGCRFSDAGGVADCLLPNRATFVLPAFDHETQTIQFDISNLLSRNNLDDNAETVTGPTSEGCLSEATDPDCSQFFISYGFSALPPTWVSAVPPVEE